MYTDELLSMQLKEISDLFLCKLEESGDNCFKADIPGCCKNERFVLRVCLCKEDGLKNQKK